MLMSKKLLLTFIVIVIASVLLLQPVLAENSPATVEKVELSADPEGSQQQGEYVHFHAEVTEGNEDAEFAFYYRLPGGNPVMVRGYDEDPNWSGKTNYVGAVEIGVTARAVGSNQAYEALDIINYRIDFGGTVDRVYLSANPGGMQAKGEEVTFTAHVEEGNRAAEFAFYYRLPGGSPVKARGYSTDNSWTTSTQYVGEAEIGVLARAIGSSAFDEARHIIDYRIVEEAPEMATVSGKAVDVTTGEPVEGAWVSFYNLRGGYEANHTETDSAGNFSAAVPSEAGQNEYHIWFGHDEYIHFALEVTITEDVNFDPVDFYPEEMGATVTGKVTDADSGDLLDTVWVDARLTGTDYFNNYDPNHHQVEGDGNYELFIPEGEYTLTFHSDGYMEHSEEVSVEAGETINLDVQLTAWGPHFTVNPRWNDMWGGGWPENTELTLTIGDPGSPDWEGSFETEEWGDFYYGIYDEHDIQFGDLVTVTDGELTRSLEVEYLIITDVDFDNNLVYGRASPGRTDIYVSVAPENDWDNLTYQTVDADQDGNFLADFSGVIDFDEAYMVEVVVYNEQHNGTYNRWQEVLYRISVEPATDHLSLHGWQSEENITVDIVGGDGYNTILEADIWGEARLDLAGVFAIEAGYEITATQGDHTETYTVTELELTEVDFEANTVSGTAAPGSLIVVLSDEEMHEVNADQDGSWVAQFDSINPGDTGYAIEYEGEMFRSSNTYLRWP